MARSEQLPSAVPRRSLPSCHTTTRLTHATSLQAERMFSSKITPQARYGCCRFLSACLHNLPILQVISFAYSVFFPALSLPNRSRSCPDISRAIKPTVTSIQPRRQINMMILNPRASKIRYLNASHSLLIDLEKHVRKVQVWAVTISKAHSITCCPFLGIRVQSARA